MGKAANVGSEQIACEQRDSTENECKHVDLLETKIYMPKLTAKPTDEGALESEFVTEAEKLSNKQEAEENCQTCENVSKHGTLPAGGANQ